MMAKQETPDHLSCRAAHRGISPWTPCAPRETASGSASLLRQRRTQPAQQSAAIPGPRAAVHAGEQAGLEARQLVDQGRRVAAVRVVIHLLPEHFARRKDVVADERPLAGAGLREQVAAEERPGRRIEQVAAFPAVRQMGRRLPRQLVPSQAQRLPVGHRQRFDVHHVADRDHRRDLAAYRPGLRRRCQEFGEAAALVRLDMREADVVQAGDGEHGFDLAADQRKQLLRSRKQISGVRSCFNVR